MNAWPPIIGAVFALLCLFGAMTARRKRRLIDDLPTSKAHGVFMGFVELNGTAEAPRPLRSVLAAVECVAYTWACEERWSRTVHYTDSKGRSQTRHESGWTTVASGGAAIPFFLRDDTGSVLVRPSGARLEMAGVFDSTVRPDDPLYYAKGPATAISSSDHIRRFTEQAIPVGARLYVVGQAREREEIVAPEIAHDKDAPLFLISTRAEKSISAGLGWQAFAWDLASLVMVAAGLLFGIRAATGLVDPSNPAPYLIAAGAWLVAWILTWSVTAYNSLVNLRQRVQQAWSLVEVQLKRRNDLIPNLVEAVTGFRDHEKKVQTELAELRTQLAATPPGRPGRDPHAVTHAVRTLVERYPELKAQDSFLALQQELGDTEQRVALARAYFNDIATFYNTRLEIVPDRWIAWFAGMKPRALMTADDFERAVPEINLVGTQPARR
jgi:hypothetical protein